MTAQVAETLIYLGEHMSMCSQPLADYFMMVGARPSFETKSSACWRGYTGTWEIVDDRLYLIELRGVLEDGSAVALKTVFPDFPLRVFANWFTDVIRIPQGALLDYVHMGYGSTYERDLLIRIARGLVKDVRVRENGRAAANAPNGYAIGAATFFGRRHHF